MIKKRFIYLLLLFLLVFNVSAQQAEFTVTAESDINLCPCSNQAYRVYVQNDKDVAQTYYITFSGTASQWAKAEPSKFTIEPGIRSYFLVYVNSECNLEGSYDLKVQVNTASIAQVLSQDLSFVECYKYDLKQGNLVEFTESQKSIPFSESSEDYEICERTESYIPILITNKENYGNTYDISLKGPEWAELSVNKVNIGAEKQGIILIKLYPQDGEKDNYSLELDLITRLGNKELSESIPITVNQCYGLSLDLEEQKDILCSTEQESLSLQLENIGTSRETIQLETSQDWAEISSNKTAIILDGNQKKTIQLSLSPNEEISGDYEIEVKGSLDEDLSYNTSDKINVNIVAKHECYNLNLIPQKDLTNKYSEEYYPIDIINTGLKKLSFNIETQEPSWLEVSPDEFILNPGQKTNLNLYANPGSETKPGNYKTILNIEAEDYTFSKELNFNLKPENKIIRSIKWFFNYYQYYIYLLIAITILTLLLIKPVKIVSNKIRTSYQEYKEKKAKKRQKEEAKKLREEERRKKREEAIKKKEEQKAKKQALKEKKISQQKKSSKILKKNKSFFRQSFLKIVIGVLVSLMVIFSYNYFEYVKEFFILYQNYVIIGVVLLAIIIFFMKFHKPIADFLAGDKK